MSLSPQQTATLKADILAKTTAGQPLEALFAAQNWDGIADFYNALASPDFPVWRKDTPVGAIFDAITWANYTPNDAADGTTIYGNRLLIIQTKQMNLQNMLVGRDTIDATKANTRAGLRDAVIALPAGAAGAAVSAGGASGVTVLTACTRKGSVIEKLLTLGPATTGTTTADLMGFEGMISAREILDTTRS